MASLIVLVLFCFVACIFLGRFQTAQQRGGSRRQAFSESVVVGLIAATVALIVLYLLFGRI